MQALSANDPNISLEANDLSSYVTVAEESDTTGKTKMLLSYVNNDTLGTKYWDDSQSDAFPLDAEYITSDMTMIRIYKVSLGAITDQDTINSIYANDLKVTVTNNKYVALDGGATFDENATYYTVTSGVVAVADVDAENFAELKANLKTQETSRARVAIGLTKTTEPAAATDISKVPDANSANVTYTNAYHTYDGSAAVLAYICVRIDGGNTKDTSAVNGDFDVKVETAAHA